MDKLLILDLDETLIYGIMAPVPDLKEDFQVGSYYVYKRPQLSEFLDFARKNFLVAIWTASTYDYAEEIVAEITPQDCPLEFVWSRKRCTRKFNELDYSIQWIKDLRKVKKKGYSLDKTIMVDDTPAKLVRNYGNLVRVNPFEGNPRDRELLGLQKYLLELREVTNVRKIEKRGWQSKYL